MLQNPLTYAQVNILQLLLDITVNWSHNWETQGVVWSIGWFSLENPKKNKLKVLANQPEFGKNE